MSAASKTPREDAKTGEQTDGDISGSSVEQYLIRDPEQFALNLARMVEEAGKAASAWVQPREKGEINDSANDQLTDMVKTFSKLTEYWLGDPNRALEAQTRLFSGYIGVWQNALLRAGGDTRSDGSVEPERGDRRFQDPEWGRNAFFDFLKQAYLVTSRWAADLVENADGLDAHTKHKAGFYMKQVSNAISPSNFILTNPELFRETIASNGENLIRGMKMLGEDIAAGKGELKVRQGDYSRFSVGKNIAVTPGKVVARSDLAEIIQYTPTTETVFKRPLLICPPWINKFYILDLNPQKSFIRWAVEQGHTVFVISWVNPDERHGAKDWEAYTRDGLQFALDSIETATGESEVNAIGYCVGGTLLTAALALMAQEGDDRISTATFFTTQIDFTHAGDLKVFVDEEQVAAVERSMSGKGFLEGTRMAAAFNMLRSGDLIWPYVVNNYMRGKDPVPFDLLYWNADSTRMAAANHSFYLRNCYLDNTLSQGRMELAGRTLSLSDIVIPVYSLAAREDHIAPAKSVFVGCHHFGGPVDFVMAGSGHIAGVVNPPEAGKYQYWSGARPVGEFENWVENAVETKGSWWPHWQSWMESHSDERVAARQPGTRSQVLGDAPGTYVKTRV
ncbi:class I poly(R)-hydroxyalkanoic acid synthase [Mesorhizobium sp. NBSH29]|uniref:PHA/PHB synthase family protein n=1 Tax=Mesorhizobium sp. NBSH29 TaxID=2654249 RepID=UPI001896443D|nr:class I poly(R)-hydroxyalkanoic acid synthase [Mesorhizobium sp. NBSH29]QPC87585.1 class I poly(R)-hydroxyalkanoic acid synthase [Mesorhizobium sp. NBSH29]